MRLPTQRTTRSPFVRQSPCNARLHRSVKTGGQTCPPKCSATGKHLNGRHSTPVRGARAPEHLTSLTATNLISETATVRAQSRAEAPAEFELRINPKLRQGNYEFQPEEFLETVKRHNVKMTDPETDGSQAMEAASERNDEGAGVGRGREHKNAGGFL